MSLSRMHAVSLRLASGLVPCSWRYCHILSTGALFPWVNRGKTSLRKQQYLLNKIRQWKILFLSRKPFHRSSFIRVSWNDFFREKGMGSFLDIIKLYPMETSGSGSWSRECLWPQVRLRNISNFSRADIPLFVLKSYQILNKLGDSVVWPLTMAGKTIILMPSRSFRNTMFPRRYSSRQAT